MSYEEITVSKILNNSSVHDVLWSDGEIQAIILNYFQDDQLTEQFHLVPSENGKIVFLNHAGNEIMSTGKIRGENITEKRTDLPVNGVKELDISALEIIKGDMHQYRKPSESNYKTWKNHADSFYELSRVQDVKKMIAAQRTVRWICPERGRTFENFVENEREEENGEYCPKCGKKRSKIEEQGRIDNHQKLISKDRLLNKVMEGE